MASLKSGKTEGDSDTRAAGGVSERDQLFASDEVAGNVGTRLITLRRKMGLSQRELARRAGMTNSTLSTIEQGKASPSIASLERILNAFPVSFAQFFSDNAKTRSDVFSPEELVSIDVGESSVGMLALSDTNVEGCYLATHRIAPHGTADFDWLNRGGTIAAVLIEGEIELYIESVKHHLLPGDSLHFSLSRGHRIVNCLNTPSVLVCTSLPQ